MDKKLLNYALLEEMHVSAYRLAKDTDLEYQTVRNIVLGRTSPTVKNARKIALVLAIPLDDLLFPAELPQQYDA